MVRFGRYQVLSAILLYVMFLGAYSLITIPTVRGYGWLACANAIIFAMVLPLVATYMDRKRLPWHVLNPSKQSWAFMFGDPLCLAPMIGIASVAWDRDLVPDFARTIWWFVLCFILGVAGAHIMCKVDYKRYAEKGAMSALSMPDKLVHDKVVVRALFCTLLTTCVPLLFMLSIFTIIVVSLLTVYGLLLFIDEKRKVDPRWQYDIPTNQSS